jgi:hypothetical protein
MSGAAPPTSDCQTIGARSRCKLNSENAKRKRLRSHREPRTLRNSCYLTAYVGHKFRIAVKIALEFQKAVITARIAIGVFAAHIGPRLIHRASALIAIE